MKYRKIILFMCLFLSGSTLAIGHSGIHKAVPHPRILLLAGEEEVIKQATVAYPVLATVHQRIMDECNQMLSDPPVERVLEGRRMLGTSRKALHRIFYLSYAYRITNEEKYAQRAEQEMLAASRFTDWNPSHFLDVGEMVMALAIGYDWLYFYLSPETRHIISTAIVEKGFKAAAPDAWFYNTGSNWNSVCNAGLVYGALAILDEEPIHSKAMIERSLKSNPKALVEYGPDGGYPEGFHYWGYGTSFEVMLIAALESAFGTDYGLSQAPGFLESARFMEFMTAPSGEYFNFSDSVNGVKSNMMMFWFAQKTKDLSLLWLERQYLEKPSVQFAEERLLPALMIFCSHLDLNNIPQPANHFWCNHGKTPVFIYRSGWDKPTDSYLAVKGGTPRSSHAHMDAGSFIYEKNGVRWAIDLGMQNYHSLESKGVDLWNSSQESQRWDVFRLSNLAHNTLTINNERHLVSSFAPISRTFETENKKGAEIDLSSVFAHQIEKAIRTIYLNKEDHLIIEDELTTSGKPASATWIMQTPADARIINENQIELTANGQRMLLTVTTPVAIKMMIWENNPLHDFDHPNPGTLRVGFESQIPANLKMQFKVTLVPTK